PYAVKVARTVLRGAALGNKCRLLDKNAFRTLFSPKIDVVTVFYRPETFSGFSKKIVSSRPFPHRCYRSIACLRYTHYW
ncbi:hypothetical protein P3533_18990, partial [Vibrio parahaemolyticus]|nr:hypothetical protein [Vibrio parahaemolyticus]